MSIINEAIAEQQIMTTLYTQHQLNTVFRSLPVPANHA